MRFPLKMNLTMARYLAIKGITRQERYPLVLMLEPLHRCNLACRGCGRIREYRDSLDETLSLDECLDAARSCGAPVVSVSGGEPLLHPEIDDIVSGLLQEGRYIYLCSNGLELEGFVARNSPHPNLFLNIHLDGFAEQHDASVCREGVFEAATDAIWSAKQKGFAVTTNTTVFKTTGFDDLSTFFSYLKTLKVDGFFVSPGYCYDGLPGENFLDREEVYVKFEEIHALSKDYCFHSSPLYLDFLRGKRTYQCAPWGTVTRNPQGWKAPCYLITDDHLPDYETLMRTVDWDYYCSGQDPRCAQCFMHSGYEPAVVLEAKNNWKDVWSLMVWNFT